MVWETLVVLTAAGLVLLLLARRLAFVSAKDACRYLQQGALIVDVRSPEEFGQRHLPDALNLPLAGLPESLRAHVSDKKQVLLLHCLAGGRSAIAKRLLRREGYVRAYNLGAYGRAERIARLALAKALNETSSRL